ncbi:MAG: hypothetical protein ACRC12_01825 [Holosporales bacterium]
MENESSLQQSYPSTSSETIIVLKFLRHCSVMLYALDSVVICQTTEHVKYFLLLDSCSLLPWASCWQGRNQWVAMTPDPVGPATFTTQGKHRKRALFHLCLFMKDIVLL